MTGAQPGPQQPAAGPAREDLTDDRPGATPLTHEDLEGLILTWVTTRGDLNAAEGTNIVQATTWALGSRRRRTAAWLLTYSRLQELHRRMFGEVWTWAGVTRTRQTNIGIEAYRIVTETENLCSNVLAQIGDGTNLAYPPVGIVARFHHQLVAIHCFPNGNGRHARLAGDILAAALGIPPLSWGERPDVDPEIVRDEYLAALRRADRTSDFEPLIAVIT